MERDSTFKEHHFWELQRRDALNSGLSLQIGATTLLIGGVYAMWQAVTTECSISNHLLGLFLMLTGVSLLATLVCLALSVFGYAYHHTPDMRTMLGDRNHYEEQYREQGGPGEPLSEEEAKKALSAFHAHMDKTYANASGHNAGENGRKTAWIYRANRGLAASLILFAVSGLPYLAVSLNKEEKPVKVQVIPPSGATMSEQKKDTPPPQPVSQQKQIQHPPQREPVVCFDHAIPPGKQLKE